MLAASSRRLRTPTSQQPSRQDPSPRTRGGHQPARPRRVRPPRSRPSPHQGHHPSPPAAERQPPARSLEQLYARTVIEIHWPDGPTQAIAPAADGATDADLRDDTGHVHLITAHNPRCRLLRHSENQERNRLLHDDLTRAGLHVVDANNRAANSSWSEDSYAVLDADTDTALDLGRRYEQTAIFEWTQEGLNVIWTGPEHPDLNAK